MANWYNELKEIDSKERIEFIVVEKTDWLKEINGEVLHKFSGNLEDVKSAMDYEFDDGYGGLNGLDFTAWTKERVYFPAGYDGSEWISSVPRNPCLEATSHQGGG